MPRYLVECELPWEKRSSMSKVASISDKQRISRLRGYFTGDRYYCLYDAPSDRTLRDHVQKGGGPVAKISKVLSILDPTKLASIIDPTKL